MEMMGQKNNVGTGIDADAASYAVVLKSRDGLHFVSCPAFGIIVEGENLDEIHDKVRHQIAESVQRYRRAGLELPPNNVDFLTLSPNAVREVSVFALKAAIVGALTLVALLLISIPVTRGVQAISNFTREIGDKAQQTVEQKLKPEAIAESIRTLAATLQQITPERRAELRESFRVIAIELQPYASELRPLFDDTGGGAKKADSPRSKLPAAP